MADPRAELYIWPTDHVYGRLHPRDGRLYPDIFPTWHPRYSIWPTNPDHVSMDRHLADRERMGHAGLYISTADGREAYVNPATIPRRHDVASTDSEISSHGQPADTNRPAVER